MNRPTSPFDVEYLKGGPGSGHHGHKGVPGQRGGSAPKGGDAPSESTPRYTSKEFSASDIKGLSSVNTVAGMKLTERSFPEITKHFESLGFKYVDVGGKGKISFANSNSTITKAALDKVSVGLVNLRNQGFPIPDMIVLRALPPMYQEIASFDVGPTGTTSLNINVSSPAWVRDEVRDSNWMSSSNKNHFINHEMGHFLHYQNSPARYMLILQDHIASTGHDPVPFVDSVLPKLSPQQTAEFQTKLGRIQWGKDKIGFHSPYIKDRIRNNVSGYASTSNIDFAAEVFAGLMDGKTYIPNIMNHYRKLGGAMPASFKKSEEIEKGGPGSGHHGHSGIPGHRGGSQPKDGGTVEQPAPQPTGYKYVSPNFTTQDLKDWKTKQAGSRIETHFKELGFKKVTLPQGLFDSMVMPDENALQAVVKTSVTLGQMKEDGFEMPDELQIYGNMFDANIAAFSLYEDGSTYIMVNTQHQAWGRGDMSRTYNSGWHSSPRAEGTIEHEFGHFMFYKNAPSRYDNVTYLMARKTGTLEGLQSIESKFRHLFPTHSEEMQSKLERFKHPDGSYSSFYHPATKLHIKTQVSEYGSSSPHEFVAEVFAGIRYGRTFNKDIMGYYKKLGGVIPKRATKGVIYPALHPRESSVTSQAAVTKGGPGSGNFGHEGRPGEIGGSTSGANVNLDSLPRSHKRIRAQRLIQGMTTNPFNENEVFAEVERKTGAVIVKPGMSGHDVHIESLRAITRGGGKSLMQEIINRADRFGITLDLAAVPMEPGGGRGVKLSPERLKAWYRGFGFEEEYKDSEMMIRRPRAKQGIAKGGPGSGHHGHSGVPGQRGGSAPKGGATAEEAKPATPAGPPDRGHKARVFLMMDSPLEINEYFHSIGLNDVDLSAGVAGGRMTVPGLLAANAVSDAYALMQNHGFPLPKRLEFAHGDGDVAGFAVQRSNGASWVRVHVGHPYWSDPKTMSDTMQKSADTHWSAAYHPSYPLIHEIAHAQHYENAPVRYRAALDWNYRPGTTPKTDRPIEKIWKKIIADDVGDKVSTYSHRNPNEFVAEVFTGTILGKTYDAEVMKYYKMLGGPVFGKVQKGGPGSGHHGHSGIPGHRGGSQPKGGAPEAGPENKPPLKEPKEDLFTEPKFKPFEFVDKYDLDGQTKLAFEHLGFKKVETIAQSINDVPREQRIAMLQMAYDTYSKYANEGYPMPTEIKFEAGSKDGTTGAFTFDPVTGATRIRFNMNNMAWHDPKVRTQKGPKPEGDGWWSTDSRNGTFIHEFGHFLHYTKNPTRYEQIKLYQYKKGHNLSYDRLNELEIHPIKKAIQIIGRSWERGGKDVARSEVSTYGSQRPTEFVAEMFAGLTSGRIYSDKAHKLYQKYGGPKIGDRITKNEIPT